MASVLLRVKTGAKESTSLPIRRKDAKSNCVLPGNLYLSSNAHLSNNARLHSSSPFFLTDL